MDLDDYQDPLDTYLAYQDGIDMKFLVERLGGSITSDRTGNGEDVDQGILLGSGFFSDSDEEEVERYSLSEKKPKNSTLRLLLMSSTDS